MTNPNPPGSVPAVLRSPRALAVWGLLGYTALSLLFSFFTWVLPRAGSGFATRSALSGFTDLVLMAMPVVAVLLAVYVEPVLSGARLVAAIALIEYAVALFFGALAFLIGLGSVFDGLFRPNDAISVPEYVIIGLAKLALIATAAYATFAMFTRVGGKFSLGAPATPTTPAP
jgi:hypothetical protein